MADVIRRNHLAGEERYRAGEERYRADEARHRADEIHVHHRPQKRSWWPFALLGLVALGLFAVWSYARRDRPMLDARAPVEKISPALPAPPPIERPAVPEPEAPIPPPPAIVPETTGPEAESTAPEADETPAETEPKADEDEAAAGAGSCSQEFDFATNETALTPKNMRLMNGLAECLKANPSEAIALEGRADQRGSAEQNEGLAQGRAQAVADALSALGVPSEQMTITIGDTLCSEATKACWQKNRSVSATSKQR